MGVKPVLSSLVRVARPAMRLIARGGYFSPRRATAGQTASIAIVACHWIGDTFWATQAIAPLRECFGGARLTVITKPACVDLWHGLVDGQDVLPVAEVTSDRRRERVSWRGLGRRARSLRAREFDMVIDLTGNRYSAWFTFMMRPRASIGFAGDELGSLYSFGVHAEQVGRHLSERPMRVVEEAARIWRRQMPAAPPPLRPPLPTCTAAEAREMFHLGERPLYVLAPGAGWAAKCWPAEKFVQAGRLLATDATVAVLGSAAETELCRRVAAGIPAAVVAAGGRLGHVVALLAEARGVLANDSGLAHLAAALGRPTAAVFTGATDPALCRPIGPAAAVFSADDAVERVVAHLRR